MSYRYAALGRSSQELSKSLVSKIDILTYMVFEINRLRKTKAPLCDHSHLSGTC